MKIYQDKIICNYCGKEIINQQAIYFSRKDENYLSIDDIDLCSQECHINSWIDIDLGFVRKNKLSKVHQKIWWEMNLNENQAKQLILVGFTPWDHEKIKSWINQGFSCERIISLLDKGLIKDDWMFASWLREKQLIVENMTREEVEELKYEYNQCWFKIDSKFADKSYRLTLTYQQKWEVEEINFSEAREWLNIGLKNYDNYNFIKLYDLYKVNNWKKAGFSAQETGKWLEAGLNREEYEKAKEAKKNGFSAEQAKEKLKPIEKDGNIWRQAQGWIDVFHPIRTKKVTDIYMGKNNLIGALIINNFPYLNTVHLDRNQIFSLEIINCPKIEKIYLNENKISQLNLNNHSSLESIIFYSNQLVDLNLTNCLSLKVLDCHQNKLTNLDVSDSPKLEKLIANNNNLEDIIFSPDQDQLVLKEVSIDNNNFNHEKLVEIENKFLKNLPDLIDIEYPLIVDRNKFKLMIEKNSQIVNIKSIDFFETWWNPNCALVINKVLWHAIHLVIYVPEKKKEIERDSFSKETKIVQPEIFKVIKLTGDLEILSKKEVQDKVIHLKSQLNSNYPILALNLKSNISLKDLSIKQKIELNLYSRPSDYLQSFDIVWRKMEGMPGAYHVGVYLGNGKVVHIGSSKFIKALVATVKGNKEIMGARVDSWEDFSHGNREFIRFYSLIPSKKPEIIFKSIMWAVLAEYGAEEYNFLGKNCEHFATLCTIGIPISTQADWLKKPFSNVSFSELTNLLSKSDKQFQKMYSTEKFIRETDKIKKYCAIKLLKLSNSELNEETKKEIVKLVAKLQQVRGLTDRQAEYTANSIQNSDDRRQAIYGLNNEQEREFSEPISSNNQNNPLKEYTAQIEIPSSSRIN